MAIVKNKGGRQPIPFEMRFWPKVEKTETCWNWKASISNTGYATFHYKKAMLAHVVLWEQINGPKPPELDLDHLCRNRSCVNPDHLELVTRRENIRRGISPCAEQMNKTHCKYGHPLIGENLIKFKAILGFRRCRTCHNADALRRHHAKKNG